MAPRVRPITDFVYEMGHGDSASPLWHSLATFPDTDSLANPVAFTLFSKYYTLPGGSLTIGRNLIVTAWGGVSSNTPVGIRMRIGSQTFFEGTTPLALTISAEFDRWYATGMLIPYVISSPSGGFFRSSGFAIIGNQAVNCVRMATAGTINAAADNVIDISAAGASGGISLEGMTVTLAIPGVLIS